MRELISSGERDNEAAKHPMNLAALMDSEGGDEGQAAVVLPWLPPACPTSGGHPQPTGQHPDPIHLQPHSGVSPMAMAAPAWHGFVGSQPLKIWVPLPHRWAPTLTNTPNTTDTRDQPPLPICSRPTHSQLQPPFPSLPPLISLALTSAWGLLAVKRCVQ